MSEWIPISERLPKDDEMMLVTCRAKNGYLSVNRAYYMDGCWHGSGSMAGVTAWMLLPEPYREEESDMDKEMTLTERIRLYADGDPECGVQPHGFDFSHEDAENMMSALRLVWLISREDCVHNFQHEREDLQDYIRVMNAMIKIAKNFVDRCPMKAEFRLRER